MMKWSIYQGILYLQTATDKQQQGGYDVVGLDRREMSCNMFSVWSLVDGWRDSGHCKAWATSVTARTVGLLTYSGMLKPGSTYGRSGNLATTTLVKTETRPKVILEAVSAP